MTRDVGCKAETWDEDPIFIHSKTLKKSSTRFVFFKSTEKEKVDNGMEI